MVDKVIQNETSSEKKTHSVELVAIALFVTACFLALSFYSYDPLDVSFYTTSPYQPKMNWGGFIGAYAAFFLFFSYGLSVYGVPFFLISLAFRMFRKMNLKSFLMWFMYFQLFLLSTSLFLSLNSFDVLNASIEKIQIVSSGGLLGLIFGEELIRSYLGYFGGNLLLCLILFVSFQGIVPFSYIDFFKKVWGLFKGLSAFFVMVLKKTMSLFMNQGKKGEEVVIEEKTPQKTLLQKKQRVQKRAKSDHNEKKKINHQLLRKKIGEWVFPSLGFLKKTEKNNLELMENFKANAEKLVQTLKEFDIQCEVGDIESGPVITRYEITIASGTKVQKVVALDNDIAYAMRAKSVRIIAPIPGKGAIGIEIPNQFRKKVTFLELLESKEFEQSNAMIPLVLGQDVRGKALIADLAKMPHLLIAGATGAGKSVCINTIVVSLLYTMSPDEVKIMMVDPKKVELAIYKDLPHLIVPLITNPAKVAQGLRAMIDEMDKRYQTFKDVGVRNIAGYNEKDKAPYREKVLENDPSIDAYAIYPDKMPYIVVIIDELADLMMVAKAEVESSIVRLAQLSRAVGIHMILATQRPSVDVVTGLIKANIPARIAFRVSARVDSRTVLDSQGAEKLLGQGDMLFLNPGHLDLIRAQGAFLDDEEIHLAVEHCREQRLPQYDQFAIDSIERLESNTEKDALFDEALEAIRESNQASTSFLQKRLRIGYNRASRLIDDLEAAGIIGPSVSGGKTREIYLDNNND